MEGKKFSLVLPAGRSVVGGWQLLARKLRSLGFSLSQKGEESSNSSSRGRGLKGVSVGKEDPLVEAEFSGYAELRNVVWLEIEKGVIDSNKEVLSKSMAGRWRGTFRSAHKPRFP